MCDYSLESVRNRPARVGEKLTTRRFPSGSVGFTAAGDVGCSTAVCLMEDTRITLENVPAELQRELGVAEKATVTFFRTDPQTSVGYRDSIRFPNGKEITLQRLGPAVSAVVEDILETPTPTRDRAVGELVPIAAR